MDLQQHIKLIGQQMVEILAGGMKSGKIALSRAKEIARFYLSDIRKVKNEVELEHDLEIMERNMPEMKSVIETEKMHKKEVSEKEAKVRVEELLKEGKIEEAAELAKLINKS